MAVDVRVVNGNAAGCNRGATFDQNEPNDRDAYIMAVTAGTSSNGKPGQAAPGPCDMAGALLEQFELFLPVFAPKGVECVTELRALQVPGWKGSKATDECGFFDLGTQLGRSALHQVVKGYVTRPDAEQPEGIYLTMNPIDPVFLARAENAMGKKGKKISAEDVHVIARRWFVVDADPVRPISGISATDSEKAAARSVIDAVREDLAAHGFADPMFCDSGNGFHLWYRIDLPRDDGGFVEHTIKGLARRHNTARATVDTSVFNPSRIMKVPGTWARKGGSTPDRPHRMACVLEIPHKGD